MPIPPDRNLMLRLWRALLVCVASAWTCPAFATDLATMSQADIRALQQRLTDAKCYAGPIDGAASAAVTDAIKACPMMDPILSIETGMHTAPINRIDVDRNCKLLATGSDDKTVRLWSLPDGRLQRILRVPIGPGNEGMAYAVALSPDARLVAVTGWDAYPDAKANAIYLFSAASGDMIARIGSFENVAHQLVFSPDGRYLVTALGKGGVHVIDMTLFKEMAADRDYKGSSYGATFAADGRLYTTAYDGYVRSYDSNFRLVNKVKTTSGHWPFSAAVDPSGKFLAVGYDDTKGVDVFRTSDLGREYSPNTSSLTGLGAFGNVAWSRDGNKLIAGSTYRDDDYRVAVWDHPRNGRPPSLEKSIGNTIMSILPCGSSYSFATALPSFGIFDSSGKVTFSKSSVTPDVRNMGDAFRVSRDGGQVRFGLEPFGKRPMLFDVSRATLDTAGERPDLTPARTTGLGVIDWNYTTSPTLNGKPLPLDAYEASRSVAIAPDQKQFALGADYGLRLFDAQGTLLWRRPASGAAFSTNLTDDGRLVIAAYGDGTVRWHRLSDGQELLALFVNTVDLRWVAWTPSGYYMASPGGEDMIGWTLNRGWEQAADFFPASRFHDRFSRPDIVQQVLVTLDEGKAIEAANKAAGMRPDLSSVTSKLPPVIKILSPADGSTVRDKDITIDYELRSPSGLPVESVDVQIEGRIARGFERTDAKVNGAEIGHLTVSIPPKNTQVGLVARAGNLTSQPATISLKWAGAAPSADDALKPKLYGVVVGVSNYRDATLNLRYPAKDARDFADALKLQQGGLYREVELKVLTDAEATSSAVKLALNWLAKAVTSRDVGLVYLAGHGVTDAKQNYYYLTYDSDPRSPEDASLEDVILTKRTSSIGGKVLVFLDTCHAGRAMASRSATYINKFVETLSSTENGIVAYASSTGKQLSLEDDSWNNGAFTKALIEGLPARGRKGQADVTHKGVISTAALDLWLAERVKELTGGAQTPVMKRPDNIPDFPLFTAER